MTDKPGETPKYISSNALTVPATVPDILETSDTELLNLDQYRRSPNRGAGASRPKRNYTSPHGEIYFKFDMTSNEICAELFAYDLAKQLDIDIATTRLAQSGSVLGVASYDIGEYKEPSDDKSYSVKDFLTIDGFIFMCLFDYLIMNEDRHAGNWGITDGKVAPLFDHNYAFGGPDVIDDADNFINNVTSAFYVADENKQMYDTILMYFVQRHRDTVSAFMRKSESVIQVSNSLWIKHFPDDCTRLNKILSKRIQYMVQKVGEFSARQVDDNEF